MGKFMIVYCVLAGVILAAGLAWLYHYHQPCLQLYGVGSPHDSVDAFLSCEDDNMARTFAFQLFAVLGVVCAALGMMIVEAIMDWRLRRLSNCP